MKRLENGQRVMVHHYKPNQFRDPYPGEYLGTIVGLIYEHSEAQMVKEYDYMVKLDNPTEVSSYECINVGIENLKVMDDIH